MRIHLLLSTALLLILMRGQVRANEITPSPDAEAEAPGADASEVVVTATRSPTASTSIPSSTSVLTREAIDKTPYRSGYQVDDLLRYVLDVQPSNLSSRYNHPTAQAVSLRGLGSRRSLVLLDGLPLNDGFGGWINWGLAPDALRRVEVVPGGNSSLYGTWAMGGVIQLLAEQPDEGLHTRADSRAGSLNTHSQSATGSYGTDRNGLLISARWFHTNGYNTVPTYQRGPIDRTDDSRHENFFGKFTTMLTSNVGLKVSGGLFHEDRTFGTPLSVATRTIGTVTAGLQGTTGPGIPGRRRPSRNGKPSKISCLRSHPHR